MRVNFSKLQPNKCELVSILILVSIMKREANHVKITENKCDFLRHKIKFIKNIGGSRYFYYS